MPETHQQILHGLGPGVLSVLIALIQPRSFGSVRLTSNEPQHRTKVETVVTIRITLQLSKKVFDLSKALPMRCTMKNTSSVKFETR